MKIIKINWENGFCYVFAEKDEIEQISRMLQGIEKKFYVGQAVYVIENGETQKRIITGIHYTTKRNYLTLMRKYDFYGDTKKTVYSKDMDKVFITEKETESKRRLNNEINDNRTSK